MFELPAITVENAPRAADWVELCALFDEGVVSHADVERVFHHAGLLGTERSDFGRAGTTYVDEDTFSDDDGSERFAEILWEELRDRARLAGAAYPFDVEGDCLARRAARWQEASGFGMLLILDIGRHYPDSGRLVEADDETARLFEKVVEASKRGLFGGRSVRFGWPRDPGWPEPIDDRIRELGERLGLEVEDLTGKTRARDKDRGLDVAARVFSDDDGGALFLLTQCAVGKHWWTKTGEPSIADWRDIFRWNSALERGVAVPWRLEDPSRARTHRRFDGAVVMDRPRLVDGHPDRFLASDVRSELTRWCQARLKKLPSL